MKRIFDPLRVQTEFHFLLASTMAQASLSTAGDAVRTL